MDPWGQTILYALQRTDQELEERFDYSSDCTFVSHETWKQP